MPARAGAVGCHGGRSREFGAPEGRATPAAQTAPRLKGRLKEVEDRSVRVGRLTSRLIWEHELTKSTVVAGSRGADQRCLEPRRFRGGIRIERRTWRFARRPPADAALLARIGSSAPGAGRRQVD